MFLSITPTPQQSQIWIYHRLYYSLLIFYLQRLSSMKNFIIYIFFFIPNGHSRMYTCVCHRKFAKVLWKWPFGYAMVISRDIRQSRNRRLCYELFHVIPAKSFFSTRTYGNVFYIVQHLCVLTNHNFGRSATRNRSGDESSGRIGQVACNTRSHLRFALSLVFYRRTSVTWTSVKRANNNRSRMHWVVRTIHKKNFRVSSVFFSIFILKKSKLRQSRLLSWIWRWKHC